MHFGFVAAAAATTDFVNTRSPERETRNRNPEESRTGLKIIESNFSLPDFKNR